MLDELMAFLQDRIQVWVFILGLNQCCICGCGVDTSVSGALFTFPGHLHIICVCIWLQNYCQMDSFGWWIVYHPYIDIQKFTTSVNNETPNSVTSVTQTTMLVSLLQCDWTTIQIIFSQWWCCVDPWTRLDKTGYLTEYSYINMHKTICYTNLFIYFIKLVCWFVGWLAGQLTGWSVD